MIETAHGRLQLASAQPISALFVSLHRCPASGVSRLVTWLCIEQQVHIPKGAYTLAPLKFVCSMRMSASCRREGSLCQHSSPSEQCKKKSTCQKSGNVPEEGTPQPSATNRCTQEAVAVQMANIPDLAVAKIGGPSRGPTCGVFLVVRARGIARIVRGRRHRHMP